MGELTVTATMRGKNQMTVPDALAERLGLQPGDKLILELQEGPVGERGFHARALPRSYAGLLNGVYGTPEEVAAYLAEERRAWDEE